MFFISGTALLCCWVFALSIADLVLASRDAGWQFGDVVGACVAALCNRWQCCATQRGACSQVAEAYRCVGACVLAPDRFCTTCAAVCAALS